MADPATQTAAAVVGAPVPLVPVTTSPVKGRLLVIRLGNLEVFDLGTLRANPLTHLPQGTYAASPALSPDGNQIVFTYYVPPKDQKDLGGSDLYLVGADGRNSRLLQAHGESAATWEVPCFAADGKSVLAAWRKPVRSNGQYTGETLDIYRVGLDGAAPKRVVANAQGPAVSPNGKSLAYQKVGADGTPLGLFVGDPSGNNARDLLGRAGFLAAQSPRFSPDDQRIAFAAVGSPGTNVPQPSIKRGVVPPFTGIAEAHGIPWDIWTVNSDGTNFLRLTHESEDNPIPAWSPDGKWIAFAGEMGLYLVDAAGKQTMLLTSGLQSGGIAWMSG
jgi:Tol biopolymer transport system component